MNSKKAWLIFLQSSEDGLAKWVEQLMNRASFGDRVSVLAAHHIAMGEWHESYFDLEDAINTVDANASTVVANNSLKQYIDEILNSDRYQAKFGAVPYLVGSYQMSNTFNFDENEDLSSSDA